MPTQFAIKFAGLAVILVLTVVDVTAWRAEQRDRAQLASELASTKKLLADADARQHDRDAQLTQTLAELVKEKQTITTPIQIVRELSKEIPLPAPITLQTDQNKPASNAKESPNTNSHNSSESTGYGLASNSQSAPAVIPQQDLKPLYDFALDCKACQEKLAAAQSDLPTRKPKRLPSPANEMTPSA